MKKLTAYVTDRLEHLVNIKKSPLERQWMDETPSKYAYRCLPLNIANQYGWDIINTTHFTAIWNGGISSESTQIEADNHSSMVVSHFGSGIITIKIPIVFRTEPGYDLFVCGPINRFKDAIQPLTGIVETDWNPTTFTMNWKFTRPDTKVTFYKNEPICHIFPIKRNNLEKFDPIIKSINDEPELLAEYKFWQEDRNNFNKELRDKVPAAVEKAWQKTYFRGRTPLGKTASDSAHQTKVRLRDFVR